MKKKEMKLLTDLNDLKAVIYEIESHIENGNGIASITPSLFVIQKLTEKLFNENSK